MTSPFMKRMMIIILLSFKGSILVLPLNLIFLELAILWNMIIDYLRF